MVSWHSHSQGPDVPFLIKKHHQDELYQFLSRDIPLNLFQLCWLENHGAEASNPQYYYFQGLRDSRGRLGAVALVISNRLLLLSAIEAADCKYFAHWYQSSQIRFQHVIAARDCLEVFWPVYSLTKRWRTPVHARLIQNQEKFILTEQLFNENLVNRPELYWQPSNVRYAEPRDLDPLFIASARMHLEETLEDPLKKDPDMFRRHVQHRIDTGRSFVWFDDSQQLVFKAEISCESSFGAQISGVYTPGHLRGQGYATRALFAICHLLLQMDLPLITLYVNTTNLPAKWVYEKIGFQYYCNYQTLFVADTE